MPRLKGFAAAGTAELHTHRVLAREGPKPTAKSESRRRTDRVGRFSEQGAIIYVCADGGKMEPDVKATLVAICEKSALIAEAGRALDSKNLGMKNRRLRLPVLALISYLGEVFSQLGSPRQKSLRSPSVKAPSLSQVKNRHSSGSRTWRGRQACRF